jgi:hypothetical protein
MADKREQPWPTRPPRALQNCSATTTRWSRGKGGNGNKKYKSSCVHAGVSHTLTHFEGGTQHFSALRHCRARGTWRRERAEALTRRRPQRRRGTAPPRTSPPARRHRPALPACRPRQPPPVPRGPLAVAAESPARVERDAESVSTWLARGLEKEWQRAGTCLL